MHIDPALSVFGVFGANDPSEDELAAARLIGAAVNARGAVLLTGGDGSDPGTVKDAAIDAANRAGSEDSPPTWMGVANTEDAGRPVWRGESSVVVQPGWGHRRNFVAACLCDVAVALGASSRGTASEALFCLYLGRPLVILGDASTDDVAARRLRESAQRRISTLDEPVLAVDRGVADAYRWAADSDASARGWPLPQSPASAEDLVATLVRHVKQPSPRLDIDTTVDEPLWDAYVENCLALPRRAVP
jgi:predicted Rossmann-fold nucleotide-binding protein